MILSHKHRFVFIKGLKVGGTSLETALLPHLDPGDEATPQQEDFGRGESRSIHGFRDHSYATEVRDFLGPAKWAEYFTFALERNPWHKTLSAYHFLVVEVGLSCSFGDYCRKASRANRWPWRFPKDWQRYSEGGRILVNRVFQFENLQNLPAILKHEHGIPVKTPLPRLRPRPSLPSHLPKPCYCKETSDLVGRHFERECAAFGYQQPD